MSWLGGQLSTWASGAQKQPCSLMESKESWTNSLDLELFILPVTRAGFLTF